MNAEAARATNAESSLGNAINGEVARAQGVEASLSPMRNNEIARAQVAEGHVVGIVESNLTTIANRAYGVMPAGPNAFWKQIADGLFG